MRTGELLTMPKARTQAGGEDRSQKTFLLNFLSSLIQRERERVRTDSEMMRDDDSLTRQITSP
jgi:hypothetical protein